MKNGIGFDSTHQAIYAFARCEQWLRDFAETHNIAFDVLTQRVAALLHSTAGGEVRGIDDTVSSLRTEATEGSEATREVEVAKRSHRKTQIIPCKQCGKMVSNTQMANHVRWHHLSDPNSKVKVRGMTLPKIMAMRKQGMTWNAIGEHFDVSTNTVWRLSKHLPEASASPKPKVKQQLSPKALRSLRKTAAHARSVLAERRAERNRPTVVPHVPPQVAEALASYQDAVASEPVPVNGSM